MYENLSLSDSCWALNKEINFKTIKKKKVSSQPEEHLGTSDLLLLDFSQEPNQTSGKLLKKEN